jgi:glycosyltransferase involved in cell wall biosynthesis
MTVDRRSSGRQRPLRIWQICESYPPKYGGGAGIIAMDVSRALAACGNEVRVLTTESHPGADDYSIRTEHDGDVQIDRVTFRYLVDRDPDGWQLGLLPWLRHERRVATLIEALIAAWRPDIVQYHTTRPFGEVAPSVIQENGIPVIAMLHEAWFICGRLTLLRSPTSAPCRGPGAVKCLECMYSHYDGDHRRAIAKLSWRIPRLGIYPAYRLWRRRAARRSLSGAIGYSHFMIDACAPHLSARADYVPLGINLEGAPTPRARRPHTPVRFGFFAGFQPNKGIWHVLDAAADLKREGLEFELQIWGPDSEGREREIAERDLQERVHLRGMYSAGNIWGPYSEVDVAIMATTVSEPFGRVPLEARAVGATTIAPRIGGIPESIRDGVDGLLYRFRDRADLTKQMRRVLTEPGLLERLCRELQPVTDTRTRGAALERVYRSILDQAGAATAR